MPNMPYYSVYNVGSYTFAPYKVVWAEQSGSFSAAVVTDSNVPLIGNRPYVPDHKIFFVEFHQERPAYYLCGLLTSSAVKEFIESHNISIQVGDIFKHMNLPNYEAQKKVHVELAEATKRAHQTHDTKSRIAEVKKVRDLADKIIDGFQVNV